MNCPAVENCTSISFTGQSGFGVRFFDEGETETPIQSCCVLMSAEADSDLTPEEECWICVEYVYN